MADRTPKCSDKLWYCTIGVKIIIIFGLFCWLTGGLIIFYSSQRQPTADNQLASGTLPEVEYKNISIILGGDAMLSRYVGRKCAQANDYTLAWERVENIFRMADLALVNLESPFAETGPYYVGDDSMVFKADPQMMAGLEAAGIDAVSLANNHILNQGQAGLEYTKQLLSQAGINYSLEEPTYLTIERGDKKFLVGLAAFSYDRGLQQAKLKEAIQTMRAQGANLIIISMHAGIEYVDTAGTQQINFARAAIDAGADIVWGHHPHVVQNYEHYQDGYIFYSLGNLIFDQDWSEPTTEGLAVQFNFQPTDLSLVDIQLRPLKIENDFQPRWLDVLPLKGQDIINYDEK